MIKIIIATNNDVDVEGHHLFGDASQDCDHLPCIKVEVVNE